MGASRAVSTLPTASIGCVCSSLSVHVCIQCMYIVYDDGACRRDTNLPHLTL
jgi:hypothetical protein